MLSMIVSSDLSIQQAKGSPPPAIGYEYLDDGKVLHMWNIRDDYYFNVSSGIQFTNHYNQYWTRNVFCGGVKLGGRWRYYCTDTLPFHWEASTDNMTYVNYTGWKVVTILPYSLKFTITYHLEPYDKNLTIQAQVENQGQRIPYPLGFAWNIRDIQIGTIKEDNNITVGMNYKYPLHNDSLNELYTNLNFSQILIQYEGENATHEGEWLGLWWDNNLKYAVQVKSSPNQYNAPVTLALKVGKLNAGQTKQTKFYWIDATCVLQLHPENPPGKTKFHDGNDTFQWGGCVDLGTSCPGTANCPGKVKIHKRPQDATGWTELAWAYSVDADCQDPNYLLTNVTLEHNDKTDLRLGFFQQAEFLGVCQDFATPYRQKIRNDYWLNNHTPNASQVKITYPTSSRGGKAKLSYDLTCSYYFNDTDGDSENVSAIEFNWTKNGIDQGINSQTLLSGNTSLGDVWACWVKVFDDVFVTGNEQSTNSTNISIFQDMSSWIMLNQSGSLMLNKSGVIMG
jgi:hypothetical protein